MWFFTRIIFQPVDQIQFNQNPKQRQYNIIQKNSIDTAKNPFITKSSRELQSK